MQGMRAALLGCGVGSLLALVLTRALSRFIYGISTTDASVYGTSFAAAALLALAASYVPARRASRVEPLAALRHE
jgi:putative ABC transport system permease protein